MKTPGWAVRVKTTKWVSEPAFITSFKIGLYSATGRANGKMMTRRFFFGPSQAILSSPLVVFFLCLEIAVHVIQVVLVDVLVFVATCLCLIGA